ncbi:MAG: hypothetical protein IJW57_11695 [Spirochaetaceae bacterium]|nr:hypothetical protein [Spirochaetaceae bacterium]
MGIVVGIAIVVVLSLIVASAFGGERGDQENRFSDPLGTLTRRSWRSWRKAAVGRSCHGDRGLPPPTTLTA